MKIYNTLFAILVVLITINFFSCNKNDVDSTINTDENDFFITNEGSFGNANASLSIYKPSTDEIINDAFFSVNNRNLGDVLQSMGKSNYKYYFLLNASNKIEVTDTELNEITTIENIILPRYFLDLGNKKAVISSWKNDGVLYLLNTENDVITDSVDVGNGAERMLLYNDKILVANSGGYYTDSTVSVINANTFDLEYNIQTKINPIDFKIIKDEIYILCSGAVIYDASWQIIGRHPSYLISLNSDLQSIKSKYYLGNFHPKRIQVNSNQDSIYLGGGFGVNGIFKIALNDSLSLPSNPFINEEFYNFLVNENDGKIYALSSPSFSASGKLKVYNNQGNLLFEKNVGIGPNDIIFGFKY